LDDKVVHFIAEKFVKFCSPSQQETLWYVETKNTRNAKNV